MEMENRKPLISHVAANISVRRRELKFIHSGGACRCLMAKPVRNQSEIPPSLFTPKEATSKICVNDKFFHHSVSSLCYFLLLLPFSFYKLNYQCEIKIIVHQ